jgi:cytochrome P450
MQCYTTQRDPSFFPRPDTFKPERWISADAITESMRTQFLPFSRGTRACLGKSLAMMELRIITATLVKYYKVNVAASTTDNSMIMKDHFLALPKSGKCDLIFIKAS